MIVIFVLTKNKQKNFNYTCWYIFYPVIELYLLMQGKSPLSCPQYYLQTELQTVSLPMKSIYFCKVLLFLSPNKYGFKIS